MLGAECWYWSTDAAQQRCNLEAMSDWMTP